jgi:hypothetical protein
MNNYHNKTRLVGKIGFLEVYHIDGGKKKVRFQLCTNTPFLDHKGEISAMYQHAISRSYRQP